MYGFWADTFKMPTIGPMFAFSKEMSEYANDVMSLGRIMAETKGHVDTYMALFNAAFAKAVKDTAERAPKQYATKDDFENYRRAMIEAFEEAFTALFASPEFSTIYGKLFSSQLDMTKVIQSMAEKHMKTLNMPTRTESDEMLKDIHELKRSVRDLRKEIEKMRDENNARSAST